MHLKVLRDPASGQEGLALSGAVFEKSWLNDLVTGAANTAYALFNQRATARQAENLAESAMAATSRVTDSFFERARGTVACREGCDHCCYQAVGVTPPEALRIVAFLRRNLSPEALEALKLELGARKEAIAGLSADQRFSPDHPCPFLEQGRCSIYVVRPLSCRGMNSLDAQDCERRLRDPEARQAFVAKGAGGRVLLDPIHAAQAVSAGLQMALSEHFFVDMRPLDLVLAMDLLFSRGASIAEEWLAGEEGFQQALGGRATKLASQEP